jgi:hypothetical protein
VELTEEEAQQMLGELYFLSSLHWLFRQQAQNPLCSLAPLGVTLQIGKNYTSPSLAKATTKHFRQHRQKLQMLKKGVEIET